MVMLLENFIHISTMLPDLASPVCFSLFGLFLVQFGFFISLHKVFDC